MSIESIEHVFDGGNTGFVTSRNNKRGRNEAMTEPLEMARMTRRCIINHRQSAPMAKLYFVNVNETKEKQIASLSLERRKKAESFVHEKDRLLSLAASLALKKGLEEYGLNEANAVIAVGEHGKPYLLEHRDLHFNLSHSEEVAMAAFADKEVGCDIEKIGRYDERIINRYFTAEERCYIEGSQDKKKAFITVWVIKESFLKAIGTGLKRSLSSFSVIPSDEGEATLRQNIDPRAWNIVTGVKDGYVWAVCEER